HDPEKWTPVFEKDHALRTSWRAAAHSSQRTKRNRRPRAPASREFCRSVLAYHPQTRRGPQAVGYRRIGSNRARRSSGSLPNIRDGDHLPQRVRRGRRLFRGALAGGVLTGNKLRKMLEARLPTDAGPRARLARDESF